MRPKYSKFQLLGFILVGVISVLPIRSFAAGQSCGDIFSQTKVASVVDSLLARDIIGDSKLSRTFEDAGIRGSYFTDSIAPNLAFSFKTRSGSYVFIHAEPVLWGQHKFPGGLRVTLISPRAQMIGDIPLLATGIASQMLSQLGIPYSSRTLVQDSRVFGGYDSHEQMHPSLWTEDTIIFTKDLVDRLDSANFQRVLEMISSL